MKSKSNFLRVTLIILFLAGPALSIRIVSDVFGQQHLLPLALTKESRSAIQYGPDGERIVGIIVVVNWARDSPGTMSQENLRNVLAATLERQTELFYIEFRDHPGSEIDVTFLVGRNQFGPFPPERMLGGIKSALLALRMTNGS